MEHAARLDRTRRGLAQRGYTLLELVVVTSLIAILAAVALPGFRASEAENLALAATHVTEAIRFTRAEAIRTGDPHLIELDSQQNQILVATADLSGATAVPGADLIHPITKQPYRIVLSDLPGTSNAKFNNNPFDFDGGIKGDVLLFDAHGLPFCKKDGNNVLLEVGTVQMRLGDHDAAVFVAPITGRVTIGSP